MASEDDCMFPPTFDAPPFGLGGPQPPPEDPWDRRLCREWAESIVDKSMDRVRVQLVEKLADKMERAYKRGRREGRIDAIHAIDVIEDPETRALSIMWQGVEKRVIQRGSK